MKFTTSSLFIAATLAAPVYADVVISEVAPWSSGNSVVAADWFEVTNTGTTPVDITGWKMDDNSNSFASSVTLRGVTSIAPGQSVIFIESDAAGTNDATINARFVQTWFGGSAPAGLAIGNYGGSGVGLSTGGDAVNLFDSAGVPTANVSFGASTTASPFLTFNNAAGLSGTITLLSAVGVNGAFQIADVSSGSPVAAIGSPGRTSQALPVPMPFVAIGVLGALLGGIGVACRRRLV